MEIYSSLAECTLCNFSTIVDTQHSNQFRLPTETCVSYYCIFITWPWDVNFFNFLWVPIFSNSEDKNWIFSFVFSRDSIGSECQIRCHQHDSPRHHSAMETEQLTCKSYYYHFVMQVLEVLSMCGQKKVKSHKTRLQFHHTSLTRFWKAIF